AAPAPRVRRHYSAAPLSKKLGTPLRCRPIGPGTCRGRAVRDHAEGAQLPAGANPGVMIAPRAAAGRGQGRVKRALSRCVRYLEAVGQLIQVSLTTKLLLHRTLIPFSAPDQAVSIPLRQKLWIFTDPERSASKRLMT